MLLNLLLVVTWYHNGWRFYEFCCQLPIQLFIPVHQLQQGGGGGYSELQTGTSWIPQPWKWAGTACWSYPCNHHNPSQSPTQSESSVTITNTKSISEVLITNTWKWIRCLETQDSGTNWWPSPGFRSAAISILTTNISSQLPIILKYFTNISTTFTWDRG